MSCFGFVWSVVSLVSGRTITVNEQTYSVIRRIGEGGEWALFCLHLVSSICTEGKS